MIQPRIGIMEATTSIRGIGGAAPAIYWTGVRAMKINPKVIDIYHLDANDARGGDGADFAKARAFGIRGVIHKATQGVGITDRLYAPRRKTAVDAGMLWGAYHFNTGESVAAQVKHFLAAAEPDAGTLMALDFEDGASNMSLAQARAFLEAIDAAIGRPAALYSGNRIKEQIAHADAETRAFFGKHKLWLCQYGPAPKLVDCNGEPLPWAKYFLWQYTGDGSGPTPHDVPGIGRRMDVNHYGGTDDELKAEWTA
jgi:GH25 family lysozyme M1 (1,4-beta-N-acetylmuramidase)